MREATKGELRAVMIQTGRWTASLPTVPMKIALADCSEHHEGVLTERPLWDALGAREVDFERPDWEDEGVDWASFDVVVVRTTWTYHHARERFLEWADQVAGVTALHNSPGVLRWNTEKSYLRDLAAAGVPVAPTEWFEQGASVDLAAILAERGWERGLLKPLVGAVASDTHRIDAGGEGLREAQAFLGGRLEERAMMLQPYLNRVETEGEVSVMLIAGEPTHAVQKLPIAGDYRVQDEHGATDQSVPLDPALVGIARRALAVAPGDAQPLYARVDFLFSGDGSPVVNELELVEPMLFFQHDAGAAEVFADAILASAPG